MVKLTTTSTLGKKLLLTAFACGSASRAEPEAQAQVLVCCCCAPLIGGAIAGVVAMMIAVFKTKEDTTKIKKALGIEQGKKAKNSVKPTKSQ